MESRAERLYPIEVSALPVRADIRYPNVFIEIIPITTREKTANVIIISTRVKPRAFRVRLDRFQGRLAGGNFISFPRAT
jgi:hypothetical protein